MFTVGLVTVPENVTGAPELQVIAWVKGLTVLEGAVVLIPIARVVCRKHPVALSIPINTNDGIGALIETEGVFAVNEGLDQV